MPDESPKMIVRNPHRELFTRIDNRSLRDPRLSWKATGVLAYLLSLPDNWEVNLEHLSKAKKKASGRAATRDALLELEGFGYIKKDKVRDVSGRISAHLIYVFEVSDSTPPDSIIRKPNSGVDFQQVEFSTNGEIPHKELITSSNKNEIRQEGEVEIRLLDEMPHRLVDGVWVECDIDGNVDTAVAELFDEFAVADVDELADLAGLS